MSLKTDSQEAKLRINQALADALLISCLQAMVSYNAVFNKDAPMSPNHRQLGALLLPVSALTTAANFILSMSWVAGRALKEGAVLGYEATKVGVQKAYEVTKAAAQQAYDSVKHIVQAGYDTVRNGLIQLSEMTSRFFHSVTQCFRAKQTEVVQTNEDNKVRRTQSEPNLRSTTANIGSVVGLSSPNVQATQRIAAATQQREASAPKVVYDNTLAPTQASHFRRLSR